MLRPWPLCALLAAAALAHPKPAAGGFVWGLRGGYGVIQSPGEYARSIGAGFASGTGAIPASTTVLRDATTHMPGYSLGASLGLVSRRIGFDAGVRYLLGTGIVNRYTAGASGSAVTVAAGDARYSAWGADLGVRWYPFSWLYLRPHIGKVLRADYTFSFTSFPDTTLSGGTSVTSYGGAAMLVFGPESARWRLEAGADYTRYRSAFGGSVQEFTIVLGPTFSSAGQGGGP